MTDFNQKNSEEVAGVAQPSTQRRALIKGAAVAAPVVLTFRSGAAFAMTSNVEVCIPRDNAMALNKPPIITVAGADNWLRKPVYCKTLTPVDANHDPILGGVPINVYHDLELSKVAWKDENNIGVSGNASYRSFRQGNGSGDPGADAFYFEELAGGGVGSVLYGYTSAVECSILIQVDENSNLNDPASFHLGNAVQISTSQGAGFPYVTGSCWGSIAAF